MKDKKTIEGILSVWIIIGLFVCFLSTLIIADYYDLGIRGQQLFHSEDFIEEDISIEHKEGIERAVDNINKNFGGPAFFESERFNIALPNLTNLGVIFSLCIFMFLWLLWGYVGKKVIGRIYHCRFNFRGDIIENITL